MSIVLYVSKNSVTYEMNHRKTKTVWIHFCEVSSIDGCMLAECKMLGLWIIEWAMGFQFFRIWKKEGGAKGKSMQLPKAIGFLLGNILVLSAATGAGTFVSSKGVHASQTQLHAPCQPRGVGLRVWMGGRLKGRGYTHTCNLHCWTAEISTALPFKKF